MWQLNKKKSTFLTHKKCSLRTLWALAHKKQRHFLGDQEPDTPCGLLKPKYIEDSSAMLKEWLKR
ncbi:hypothetical protein J4429_04965 [Candidatus Pacearchaeota archaeon]|nr:hypothetical protein [Candidatus Pacearchaeota archaeon]